MVGLDVPRLSFGEQARECPGTKYYCEEIRVFKAGVMLEYVSME